MKWERRIEVLLHHIITRWALEYKNFSFALYVVLKAIIKCITAIKINSKLKVSEDNNLKIKMCTIVSYRANLAETLLSLYIYSKMDGFFAFKLKNVICLKSKQI